MVIVNVGPSVFASRHGFVLKGKGGANWARIRPFSRSAFLFSFPEHHSKQVSSDETICRDPKAMGAA
jgi:hypothetical protein